MTRFLNYTIFRLLFAAWACCAVSPLPAASLEAFASARTLHGGEGSLRLLTLNPAIYHDLRQPDLGDIRIFNGAGREVPMLLRGGRSTTIEDDSQRTLEFYPLPGAVEERQPLGGLSLRLERSDQGEILQLDSRPPAPLAEDNPPRAYLIDLGSDRLALQALHFAWAGDRSNLLANFRLSHSDDLMQWRPLTSEGLLSSLRYGDALLKRDRIEVQTQRRFLRLEWLRPDQRPLLTAIHGRFRDTQIRPAETRWLELGPPVASATGDDYRFDTGGPFALTRLALQAPTSGLFYQGRLWSSPTPDGPWRQRGGFHQYLLEIDGENWQSEAMDLHPTRDRHWRIAFTTPKNPLKSELPSIRIAYAPDQILFLAQGEAPFELAYGSAIVSASASPLASLIKELEADGKTPSVVSLSEARRIGGGEKPPLPIAWESYLLWALLLSGVALLAGMARKLLRELNDS